VLSFSLRPYRWPPSTLGARGRSPCPTASPSPWGRTDPWRPSSPRGRGSWPRKWRGGPSTSRSGSWRTASPIDRNDDRDRGRAPLGHRVCDKTIVEALAQRLRTVCGFRCLPWDLVQAGTSDVREP